jgi:hypothetical protein
MSTQHPDSGAQPAVKFAKSAVKQIENGFSITTDMPPCCLEFCPDAPDFFAVGCYKLVEDDPPSKTETEDDSKSEDKVEKEMEAMSIEDRNFLAEEPEQDGGKDISNSLEIEEAFDAASIKRKDFAEQPKPASTKSPQKRVGCLYLYKLYCVDGQTTSCVSLLSTPFPFTCFKKTRMHLSLLSHISTANDPLAERSRKSHSPLPSSTFPSQILLQSSSLSLPAPGGCISTASTPSTANLSSSTPFQS